MSRWNEHRYWDGKLRQYVIVEAKYPTSEQFARLDEYLANPKPFSILPSWETAPTNAEAQG